ncbi:hypothetical protein BGX28_000625 [Mortierella sp. GBA30]|nr:hypothetical protein BGX28_000625 [Mortierella sp. GBA30]
MTNIAFDESFVPEGVTNNVKGTGAIILGVGVQWKDAYKAADERNVTAVGVMKRLIVTADGEVKFAIAYQNRDLFRALLGGGGGGGTFGVVFEGILP